MIARYATLHEIEGYAVRTDDRRVMFFDTHGTAQQLTNADIPELVLLGEVGLAEEGALMDKLAGGHAALACSRKSER